jgi:6-pyruvoyltetrahydropterin/6-carboxytetrahydropterin synthase
VLVQCDHHTLNDFMDNPTAENVVAWMWERLKPQLEGLKELRLWETPEYCVTYRED